MPPGKIGPQEWSAAAFAALTDGGPQAVTVEGVSRRLRVTKGSFYWHFSGRADLLRAALDHWQAAHTDDIIAATGTAGPPLDRLRLLFRVVADEPAAVGELALYAGADDPVVASAVAEVTRVRTRFVADLLQELGFEHDEAWNRAALALAMVIGRRTLARAVPDLVADPARSAALVDTAVRLLTV